MSLINEALKKAQKQRTGENPSSPYAMPNIGGESAGRIARSNQSSETKSFLVKVGLGGGIVILSAAVIFLWLRTPQAPIAPPVVAPAPVASVPVTLPVAKENPAAVATEHPTAFVLNIPPTPPIAEPGATASPLVAAPTPVPGSTVASVAVATPGAPLKFELRAITFVETLRVTGIRAAGADSKVLMNDRVYRPGDIVEHELGIKLLSITANSLTFQNEQGVNYTRNF